MARGINKVTLIGNLGRDPELKTFPNGGSVCNASLATTETWKNKSGERQEHTEWHNLVFNDRLAEIANEYLRKGSTIYVEGKIRTRKYQDKEGKERYVTEIRVGEMQMLDGKPDGGHQSAPRQSSHSGHGSQYGAPRTSTPADAGFGGPDDDIPF